MDSGQNEAFIQRRAQTVGLSLKGANICGSERPF